MDSKIKEVLHNIYISMPKESLPEKGDGWVNQKLFEREVQKERINFKNMGYTWFYEFLKDSDLFHFWKEQGTWYANKKAYSKSSNTQRKDVPSITLGDTKSVKKRLRLENNQFIGQFVHMKDGI